MPVRRTQSRSGCRCARDPMSFIDQALQNYLISYPINLFVICISTCSIRRTPRNLYLLRPRIFHLSLGNLQLFEILSHGKYHIFVSSITKESVCTRRGELSKLASCRQIRTGYHDINECNLCYIKYSRCSTFTKSSSMEGLK